MDGRLGHHGHITLQLRVSNVAHSATYLVDWCKIQFNDCLKQSKKFMNYKESKRRREQSKAIREIKFLGIY